MGIGTADAHRAIPESNLRRAAISLMPILEATRRTAMAAEPTEIWT